MDIFAYSEVQSVKQVLMWEYRLNLQRVTADNEFGCLTMLCDWLRRYCLKSLTREIIKLSFV